MKPKHYGLITLVLALSIVGAVTWFGLAYHHPIFEKSTSGAIKPISELNVPDQNALEKMDRIERSMHLLSSPQPRIKRKADLSALGYVPVSATAANRTGDDVYDDLAAGHRITMAFEGRVNRYCIIDSKLYPEGAVLPDGATIVKIESRRVLIAKESLQQWLVVDPQLGTTLSEKRS